MTFLSRLLQNFRLSKQITIFTYILGKLFYMYVSWIVTTFEHSLTQDKL